MTDNMQPESAWLPSRHAIDETGRYFPLLSLQEIETRLIRAFGCGDIRTILRYPDNDGVVSEEAFDRSDWRFVETLNPTTEAWISASREMGGESLMQTVSFT